MDILLTILAFVLAILGLIGAIVPALPGALLSYAALVCAYFCSYADISSTALIVWLVISIAVSLFDYFLPIYFTRRFGGSQSGVRGATIGMIAGFFVFPPIGLILCPILGAIIGELAHNREDLTKALRVGFGSFVAFLLGNGSKLLTSLLILFVILRKTLPSIIDTIVSIF